MFTGLVVPILSAILPKGLSLYLDPLEALTVTVLAVFIALLILDFHYFRMVRRSLRKLEKAN